MTFCISRCRRDWSLQLVGHNGSLLSRHNSSGSKSVNKAFSETLLLPQTSFPLRPKPTESELPFRKRTCEDLYRWQWQNASGPLFVLHDGPPYANGSLHIGHALNKIIKDIINRYHVLLGRRVHYVPGWDCHGLPIENKVLQELGVTDSRSVSPSKIREAAESYASREIERQKQQFRQFGVLADWDSNDSTYRTLDHSYEMRQLRIFQRMVQNGLIYRHYRPVYFSPSSHSALAEAELEYKEDHVSHSVYITFQFEDGASFQEPALANALLLVWTTTPWTLTANMGLAVNSELQYSLVSQMDQDDPKVFIVASDRIAALSKVIGPVQIVKEMPGSDLVGKSYKPLFSALQSTSKPLNIVSASHVTSESGTGLVHCAPAHGSEDYNAFRALGLISDTKDMTCHVDASGNFHPKVSEVVGSDASQQLVGKDVLGIGSRAVVDLLRSMDRLVKVERYKHKFPYDWKTKQPVIVTATSQWFANLEVVKERALQAIQDVSFVPSHSRNRLNAFIQSRGEWCISRQRVWGIPIPSLHHVHDDKALLTPESLDHILSVLEEKGTTYWWTGPVEEFMPPSLRGEMPENWRKGTDTMDVWFDSGTSWSMLEGVPGQEGRAHKADVCVEGSDQHRGWFQSQLLTALSSDTKETAAPYKTLITHGMVLDSEGRKMSKSLGNIVDPLDIVKGGKDTKAQPAYGADVLRLWAASTEFWRDIPIGKTQLAQTAESMRKIRNSARFALGNIGSSKSSPTSCPTDMRQMQLMDRFVMHELYNLEQTAIEGYSTYNFSKVTNALINFCNITLSSLYFDINKDCLYADALDSPSRRGVVMILKQILDVITPVMAPILPYLAEEIHMVRTGTQSSAFERPWIPMPSSCHDPEAAKDVSVLLKIRSAVLSLLEKARTDKLLKSSLEAEVDIILPTDSELPERFSELLLREESMLKTLFIVSDVTVTDEGSLGTSSPAWTMVESLTIPDCDQDIAIRARPSSLQKCPRCWTFTRHDGESLCDRCSEVLGTGNR